MHKIGMYKGIAHKTPKLVGLAWDKGSIPQNIIAEVNPRQQIDNGIHKQYGLHRARQIFKRD